MNIFARIKRSFHFHEPRFYYQRIGVRWHRMSRREIAAEFLQAGSATNPQASELGYCLRRDPGFIYILGRHQRPEGGYIISWVGNTARVPVELPAGSKWRMPLSMGAIHAN